MMTTFDIQTRKSASRGAREILAEIEDTAGFIPNVFGLIANSPNALAAAHAMNTFFRKSSFTEQEQEVIALATSVQNQCAYCVAGHTTFALAVGIAPSVVADVRRNTATTDRSTEALRHFVSCVVRERGAVSRQELASFIAGGFTLSQVFELLIGVATKTVTNFASKIAGIPVDEAFAAHVWSAEVDSAEGYLPGHMQQPMTVAGE